MLHGSQLCPYAIGGEIKSGNLFAQNLYPFQSGFCFLKAGCGHPDICSHPDYIGYIEELVTSVVKQMATGNTKVSKYEELQHTMRPNHSNLN